jgi:predicted DNA-binding protein YlxM (UPF0122 family)
MKINRLLISTIIHDYSVNHVPMIELARRHDVTRATIYKLIKRHSKETQTSKKAAHILTECTYCRATISVLRSRFRVSPHHFCNKKEFGLWQREQKIADTLKKIGELPLAPQTQEPICPTSTDSEA